LAVYPIFHFFVIMTTAALGLTEAESSSHPVFSKDNGTAQVFVTAKPTDNIKKDLLIVSPYEEEPHLLNLNTLDTFNQLLAKALVCMKNLREDYATADYKESFNCKTYFYTNFQSPSVRSRSTGVFQAAVMIFLFLCLESLAP
jgi:hypothetical protein